MVNANMASAAAEDLSKRPLSVSIVVVTTVKPLRETADHENIDATVNDILTCDSYFPLVFSYRIGKQAGGDNAYLQLVSRMKNSLRKVLDSFYPYAGRWVATSEGYKRSLLCNDAGVPFIETYAHENLDDFLPAAGAGDVATFDRARVSALFTKGHEIVGLDATRFQQEMRPGGLPNLVVQVTRFKCGGVVVSPTFNHMLCDGTSSFDFLKAWSEIALTGETTITPDFNRAAAAFSTFEDFAPRLDSEHSQNGSTHLDSEHSQNGSTSEQLSKKVFEVRKSVIESMKGEVKESTNGTQFVSTLDCIYAKIWQSLLKLPSSIIGDLDVAVRAVVQGRTRFFNPPLSKHLCGNVASFMLFPSLPPAEILGRPASFTALKLREKLEGTTQQEWLSRPRVKECFDVFSTPTNGICIYDSWLKFPMYDIDFGFAKPSFASHAQIYPYPFGSNFLGLILILPPIPGKGDTIATIHFDMRPWVLQALSSDSQFRSLFI